MKKVSEIIKFTWIGVLVSVQSNVCAQQQNTAQQILDIPSVIQRTLSGNSLVQIQKLQIEAANADVQQSGAPFGVNFSASIGRQIDNQPINDATKSKYISSYGSLLSGTDLQFKTYSNTLQFSASKALRNGVSVNAFVNNGSTDGTNNLINGWPKQNAGMVGFTVNIPLLKSSTIQALANEMVSEANLDAARYDLSFSLGKNITDAITAYWNVVAAHKNLEILTEGENNAVSMLEEMKKLVLADEIPASDLKILQASISDRRSARVGAASLLRESYHSLASIINYPIEAVRQIQVMPEFSKISISQENIERIEINQFQNLLNQRADILSAEKRLESNRKLLDFAKRSMSPQLDIVIGSSRRGLIEGAESHALLNSAFQNKANPNYSVALLFQRSFDNAAAEGQYKLRQAMYEQSLIQFNAVKRNAMVSIESSRLALMRSAAQLKESRDAATVYQASLQNEITKRRLGASTILNVINVSESLRNTRLAEVKYQLDYMTALAKFTFETSNLISDGPNGSQIDYSKLVNNDWLNFFAL
jgi:outer membrane protein TolC